MHQNQQKMSIYYRDNTHQCGSSTLKCVDVNEYIAAVSVGVDTPGDGCQCVTFPGGSLGLFTSITRRIVKLSHQVAPFIHSRPISIHVAGYSSAGCGLKSSHSVTSGIPSEHVWACCVTSSSISPPCLCLYNERLFLDGRMSPILPLP